MPVARIAAVAALVAGLVAGAIAPASSEDKTDHKAKGDFRPMDIPELVIEGKAEMDRTKDGTTEVKVKVKGLEPGKTYASHLHNLPCASRSGHYQNVSPGSATPPNELWISSDPSSSMAGLTADQKGKAKGEGTAPWTARAEAQSVVIHDPALPATGNRIACADLS